MANEGVHARGMPACASNAEDRNAPTGPPDRLKPGKELKQLKLLLQLLQLLLGFEAAP